jgi:hypothetical protein
MDPLQFESFKKLRTEDLEKVRLDYARFLAEHRALGKWSNWFWFALTIAAFLGFLFIHVSNSWAKSVLFAIWALGAYLIAKREGKNEGYLEGYEEGHDAGIHKALGVSEDDARFYYDAAMDMKINNIAAEQRKEP